MKIKRKKTRVVRIGDLKMGGNNPIVVQTMTKTDTRDVEKTVKQILEAEEVGCELVRVAVPDMEAAKAVKKIKKEINIPLVVDIHFDYRLALESMKNGADKVRINPGNIGGKEKVKMVVDEAKDRGIPIRIGVNAGSLEKDLYEKYGISPESLVESALRHVRILEDLDFYDIVISVKDSDVLRMIESYRLLSEKVDYPLHLGVTHSGTVFTGGIKSAIGIGTLLMDGIGDTIRVSLPTDPWYEVRYTYELLKALKLRERGPEYIVCPTCGRTEIEMIPFMEKIEELTKKIKSPIKIAIMGCVVNGPGEAREADIGISGGKHMAVIFKKGKPIRTVKEEEMYSVFLEELKKTLKEMYGEDFDYQS